MQKLHTLKRDTKEMHEIKKETKVSKLTEKYKKKVYQMAIIRIVDIIVYWSF